MLCLLPPACGRMAPLCRMPRIRKPSAARWPTRRRRSWPARRPGKSNGRTWNSKCLSTSVPALGRGGNTMTIPHR
ncbi:hypothetical protein EBU02_03930 [bacterium]|nr:hypothetical protein [bacterium]NBS53279.1 hypothetical protein [Spartobacteria bacterium]